MINEAFDDALNLIKTYVKSVGADPESTLKIYSSIELDQRLEKIGSRLNSRKPIIKYKICDKKVVILASHIETIGGHSRAIFNLIRMMPGSEFHIILTDIYKATNLADLKAASLPNAFWHIHNEEYCPTNLVKWINETVCRISPSDVYLFNHPEDVAIITSATILKDYSRVLFCHHADHNLCLGVRLCGVIHLDFHNIIYNQCKNLLGIDSKYFPLAIIVDSMRCEPMNSSRDFVTASSGSKQKFDSAEYYIDFSEVICARLQASEGTHIHYGEVDLYTKNKWKKYLENQGVDNKRIIFSGRVESLRQSLVNDKVNLYISSVPISGGLATIEAMSVGCPVVMHLNKYSRPYSGIDLVYDNVLKWGELGEFYTIVENFDVVQFELHSKLAIDYVKCNHETNLLIEHIESGFGLIKPRNTKPYIDADIYKAEKFGYNPNFFNEAIESLFKISDKCRNYEFHIESLNAQIIGRHRSLNEQIELPNTYKILRFAKYPHAAKKILNKAIQYLNKIFEVRTPEIQGDGMDGGHKSQVMKHIDSEKYIISAVTDDSKRSVLLVDHNGGGGSNKYTRELLNELCPTKHIIRVYKFKAKYALQYIQSGDQILNYYESLSELFEFLKKAKISEIIINSIYGVDDINRMIDSLIDLKEWHKSHMSFNVHDYHSICPSPHLLNYKNKYCGIPKDFNECRVCLPQSYQWYQKEITSDYMCRDIELWRKNFTKLFEHCDNIVVFNESSIDILEKAFNYIPAPVNVIPHKQDIVQHNFVHKTGLPMKIGVIGMLVPHKGREKVIDVAKYMQDNRCEVKIVTFGHSDIFAENVINTGYYKESEIAEKVFKNNISVVFFSSIVPETFSYVISEIISLNLPIVSYNIGAQGQRVSNYHLGYVIPLDASPSVVYNALLKAHNSRN